MSNIYHILYAPPDLEEDDTYSEVEALASRLVESGRFRVDIDYNTLNFTRFTVPSERVDVIFSERELYRPELLAHTERLIHQALMRLYPVREKRMVKVKAEIERLRLNLKKYQPVKSDIEMKLARVVVQSAHPVVMMLMLWERVEVFVSYSYAIGDMLDMVSWQSQRSNSGMQSADGRNAAIYISAGGDPFGAPEEEGVSYGDGPPALARMMIIGAQELGHYSDIMRDETGRQRSRFSANFSGTRAKERALMSRRMDKVALRKLHSQLNACGMDALFELEREAKFYRKIKRSDLKSWYLGKKIRRYTVRFRKKCREEGIMFLPAVKLDEGYLAMTLVMILADTKFNLEPKADAYSRSDPQEEEAVACIEAVARVPQQVIKWGHRTAKAMMPHLYDFYYEEIIPSCIRTYHHISGEPYHFTFTKKRLPLWKRIRRWFKRH